MPEAQRFEIRRILAVDTKGETLESGEPMASQEDHDAAIHLAGQLAGAERYGVAIVDAASGTRDLRFKRI